MTRLAILIGVVCLFAGSLQAQSLSEAAAKARAARGDTPTDATAPTKVYTDKDLTASAVEAAPSPPPNTAPGALFTLWETAIRLEFPTRSEPAVSDEAIYRPAGNVKWTGPALPLRGVSWDACQRGLVDTVRVFVNEWRNTSGPGQPQLESSSRDSLTLKSILGSQVLMWKCKPTT